jgi:hypothetical protein
MESHLVKHILPRFGDLPLDGLTDTKVQEFVADLGRTTFEMKKPNGDVIKTYRLSRKTILNVVGVVKIVVGRKRWMQWELNLGKPSRPRQRYFTDEQLKRIIEAAPGQYQRSSHYSPAPACASARRRDSTSKTSIWRTG